MRIEFLKAHANIKPGRIWDHPWACVAKELIRQGIARAVDPADNLAPTVRVSAESPSASEPPVAPSTSPPAHDQRSARRRR